ncbi:MAG: hypothetical protein R3E10_09505 [Gemmatimonadota bacterium]
MQQLITELWAWFLGSAVVGAAVAWLLTHWGASRRLRDNEDGWRRRVRAIEEGWLAKLENVHRGHQTELDEREGRINHLSTDLEAQRGRVTALKDDLDAEARLLAERDGEIAHLKQKLAQLDDRLADALERSDQYEVELRAIRVEAEAAARDRNDLATKLSQRGTRLQELESTLSHREERIQALEPLVDRLREREDQIALVQKEHAVETGRLGEEGARLRARVAEIPGLEQQLRERYAELEALRGKVARLEPLTVDLEAAHAENARLLQTAELSDRDLAALREKVVALDARLGEERERSAALEGRSADLAIRVTELEASAEALAACRAERDALGARLREATDARGRISAEHSAEIAGLRARIAQLERRPLPTPDDLKRIKGVGPALEKLLHSLGIRSYRDMAVWSEADIERIDGQLGEFHGRIRREGWVGQAATLQREKYGED